VKPQRLDKVGVTFEKADRKFGVGLVFHFGEYVDALPDEWVNVSITASVGSELVGTIIEWGIISDVVLFGLMEIKDIRACMWLNYTEHSF